MTADHQRRCWPRSALSDRAVVRCPLLLRYRRHAFNRDQSVRVHGDKRNHVAQPPRTYACPHPERTGCRTRRTTSETVSLLHDLGLRLGRAWHFYCQSSDRNPMKPNSTLRIASYNIQKCVGLDFRRQPQRILQVIESMQADIVVLQEADKRLPPRPAALPHFMLDEAGLADRRSGRRGQSGLAWQCGDLARRPDPRAANRAS